MTVVTDKKKNTSFNSLLAAAKKLSTEEKQQLRINLFGGDIIKELGAFEAAMKKQKPSVKKSDEEIVNAVNKVRVRNAR